MLSATSVDVCRDWARDRHRWNRAHSAVLHHGGEVAVLGTLALHLLSIHDLSEETCMSQFLQTGAVQTGCEMSLDGNTVILHKTPE